MPLTPFNGVLGKKRAAHLLRRATFGPTKAQIEQYAGFSAQQAITQLFQNVAEPTPPIDPSTGTSDYWTDPSTQGDGETDYTGLVKGWLLGQILGNDLSARDKLVFFLHTQFPTIGGVVRSGRALYYQLALFYKFALDKHTPEFNFKLLATKMCLDNAMIRLLDNDVNVEGAINENYGRELLELHVVGKGREGQPLPETNLADGDYYYFTEEDVVTTARVVSGYDFDNDFSTLDEDTDLPRGIIKGGDTANRHDNDPKVFSARLGGATVTPDPALLTPNGDATEASVLDELNQLMDILFNQTEVARYICRRLYRFFVYHDITDAIDADIITDMANIFTSSGFQLQEVVEQLLGSQHFYDAVTPTLDDDNFGGIVKSPLDLSIGSFRFFGVTGPDINIDPAAFYEFADNVRESLEIQGMSFLEPFDVAGYDAYHQVPEFNRNWISANTLTRRYEFISQFTNIDMMMEPNNFAMDVLAFTKANFSDAIALDPDQLVREYASLLLPRYEEGSEITTERLEYFKAEFLKLGEVLPQGALAFWQFSYSNAGTIPASEADARQMLVDLINAML